MSKIETPIVVIAYNRAKSLNRLLESLGKANYPSNQITLIISIDQAEDNKETLKIAEDFEWEFGNKIVNYEKTNLGLRNHVLKCGNLSEQYGSVIILEDDLYISPNFYLFAKQALNFSEDQSYIGGISLYNHQMNVHTMDNFAPIEDGYDNWYFQFASSWGQAWSSKQWNHFYSWYQNNQHELAATSEIPSNVTDWSDRSWLKYFIAYLIQTDKFFLYPKVSLATNFSDVGTHVGLDSTAYQISLDFSKEYFKRFSTISESNAVYDAFYENLKLFDLFNLKKEELEINLFGYKPTQKRYILTPEILNFTILKAFGKSLKPIDANIIQDIPGRDIFLYDTSLQKKNPYKSNRYRNLIYNIKFISLNDSFLAWRKIIITRIKLKLRS